MPHRNCRLPPSLQLRLLLHTYTYAVNLLREAIAIHDRAIAEITLRAGAAMACVSINSKAITGSSIHLVATGCNMAPPSVWADVVAAERVACEQKIFHPVPLDALGAEWDDFEVVLLCREGA